MAIGITPTVTKEKANCGWSEDVYNSSLIDSTASVYTVRNEDVLSSSSSSVSYNNMDNNDNKNSNINIKKKKKNHRNKNIDIEYGGDNDILHDRKSKGKDENINSDDVIMMYNNDRNNNGVDQKMMDYSVSHKNSCLDTNNRTDIIGNVGDNNSIRSSESIREYTASNYRTSTLDGKWENMFERLLKFRERTGHCLVPNRFPKDPKLGLWVSTQRRQYKKMISGESDTYTPMTPERANRLSRIGFKWATTDPRHAPWEQRFEQLLKYVKKNGHSKVPMGWKENIQLANWVSTQRQEYKLRLMGRSSRLTDDKIQLLNDIGFVWEAQRGGPRKQRKSSCCNNSTNMNKRSSITAAEEEGVCAGSSFLHNAAKGCSSIIKNNDPTTPHHHLPVVLPPPFEYWGRKRFRFGSGSIVPTLMEDQSATASLTVTADSDRKEYDRNNFLNQRRGGISDEYLTSDENNGKKEKEKTQKSYNSNIGSVSSQIDYHQVAGGGTTATALCHLGQQQFPSCHHLLHATGTATTASNTHGGSHLMGAPFTVAAPKPPLQFAPPVFSRGAPVSVSWLPHHHHSGATMNMKLNTNMNMNINMNTMAAAAAQRKSYIPFPGSILLPPKIITRSNSQSLMEQDSGDNRRKHDTDSVSKIIAVEEKNSDYNKLSEQNDSFCEGYLGEKEKDQQEMIPSYNYNNPYAPKFTTTATAVSSLCKREGKDEEDIFADADEEQESLFFGGPQ